MKRKRIVPGRKICERKKRLTVFIEGLRRRFKELEREEEEFRILALMRIPESAKNHMMHLGK